eukprot:gene5969-6665_t
MSMGIVWKKRKEEENEIEEEARKFSANERVYMASGVRCDGKKSCKT